MLTGLGLGLGGLVALIMVTVRIKRSMSPTKGRAITNYLQPCKALLVVDIQEDLTGSLGAHYCGYNNTASFIAAVNQVIDVAQAKGMIVVYIGHECPATLFYRLAYGGRLLLGRPGSRQDHRLNISSPYYFTKCQADAFSNPGLENFLISKQVAEITVVGLDGVQCVFKTAQGGQNRNYKVNIMLDAVATTRKTKEQLSELYRKNGISVNEGVGMATL